jgi:hypothetical protein
MVGTLPRRNLSQQIPIAIHKPDMASNPVGISNLDMASNPVGISSLAGISNLDMASNPVDINRGHMEHLLMEPRVL